MKDAFWLLLALINTTAIILWGLGGDGPSWWTVVSALALGASVTSLIEDQR
jgi:uncharacterized membrane protein AbrB (regulator of aidB expression)